MRSQASELPHAFKYTRVAIVIRRSLLDGQRQLHARVRVIHQIVDAVYLYDVDVIVVAPSAGPCFGNEERIASIFKPRPAFHYCWMSDVKPMFLSEIGPVLIVWNSPVLLRCLLILLRSP
jgi:hypothetical protein